MKKSTLKKLRQISESLPKSIEEYNAKIILSGQELIDQGIHTVKDSIVDKDSKYTQNIVKVREFNHYRRLKKYYKKYKLSFIDEYMKWFKVHHEKMILKYPQMFKKIENGSE